MRQITFNEFQATELYELALEHFQKDCINCELLKKKMEKFLGDKEVKRIKKVVKKDSYCRI